MDLLDLAYLTTVSTAGALARAVAPALPAGWRLRLDAEVPDFGREPWVWVHAVSVGELILAERLLGELRARGLRLHVTTGTPAGLELLMRRLPGWDGGSGQITGGAFPVDDPEGLRPFLRRPPALFVALETELWPELIRRLKGAGTRIAIVNGRLTPRTLASKGRAWLGRAASRLDLVVARDVESQEAFQQLGAPRVVLGGNLKADAPAPRPLGPGWEALRTAWAEFPVVVTGNTLEGEEALVLSAWRQARGAHPQLRLILAPRQPRRFQEVADLLEAQGVAFHRASGSWADVAWERTEVLLLDTLGDLAAAYGEGDLALIGGGWTWHGGHNPLESVRWGLPTWMGPGYANFEDLVKPLQKADLVEVVRADALQARLSGAWATAGARQRKVWGAAPLPQELQGTLQRTLHFLDVLLPDNDCALSGVPLP